MRREAKEVGTVRLLHVEWQAMSSMSCTSDCYGDKLLSLQNLITATKFVKTTNSFLQCSTMNQPPKM